MNDLPPGIDLKMNLEQFQVYCSANNQPYVLPPLFQHLQNASTLSGGEKRQQQQPPPQQQMVQFHQPGSLQGAVAYQPGQSASVEVHQPAGQPVPIVKSGQYAGAMVYQPGAPASMYKSSEPPTKGEKEKM